jgi:CDGSH-type Zn-finger protein
MSEPEEPVVFDKRPVKVDLEPGTYWWCSCGKSQKQPFCDGSHKGSPFRPVKYEVAEGCSKWMCQCKKTGNQPLCDGAHKGL